MATTRIARRGGPSPPPSPSEIHALHRALRGVRDRWRLAGEEPRRAALVRGLRPLLDLLGSIRDLDAGEGLLRRLRSRASAREQRATRRIERALSAERARLKGELSRRLAAPATRRLLTDVDRETRRLPPRVASDERERARRRLLRARDRALQRPSPRRLHRFRARARQLGIAREHRRPSLALPPPRVNGARRLLRQIGRHRDVGTLRARLRAAPSMPGAGTIDPLLRREERRRLRKVRHELQRRRAIGWA